MNPAYPSFQIYEFIRPDGLTGRNCGTPLNIGMKFNSIRRTRFFGDITDLHSEDVGDPMHISLTLNRIEAYQHELDELSPGLTALLRFSGDSLKAIRAELKSLPRREYLRIESID